MRSIFPGMLRFFLVFIAFFPSVWEPSAKNPDSSWSEEMINSDAWVWVPFEVDRQFDGYRVDCFLSQRLAAYSRGRVQKILDESRVMRGERLIKASSRVRQGERILIAYPRRP